MCLFFFFFLSHFQAGWLPSICLSRLINKIVLAVKLYELGLNIPNEFHFIIVVVLTVY